jgi:hypothetical protein
VVAGTSPHGLFRSDDGGDTWESVAGFNDHPRNEEWTAWIRRAAGARDTASYPSNEVFVEERLIECPGRLVARRLVVGPRRRGRRGPEQRRPGEQIEACEDLVCHVRVFDGPR